VKTDNGEVQLQALVDWKKIIITESTVRRDFQLEDAESVDCLPNSTIFEQLTLMSSKTTAWNEFSSTMASAIICLATNQMFNFSKYIFENNVADEVVNEEIDDSLERAATTATSLDAKHDRGNINKTQSKATPNKAGFQGTTSGGGPRCQETMGDTIAQTRVLDLETTKTTQANEMASLKKRVKKLERKNKSRTHGLKRMYRVGSLRRVESSEDEGLGEEDASKQGRIVDIDANKYIYLVNVHTDEDMFGVNDLDGDEVIVDNVNVVKTAEETRSVVKEVTAVIKKAKFVSAAEEIVNDAATTVSTASTIPVKLKSAKPKADKVVIQEPEQGTTTPTLTTTTDATTITAVSIRPRAKRIIFHDQEQAPTPTVSSQQPTQVKVQDKGKGKMVKPEPAKKMSKKELLRLDEELTFKLQAEEEEEERLAREKA
ncbi:hypothetical protein Tco_1431419, partial [Tanacetum coccineum]